METDCDISLSGNYCLICGSSSLDGSSDEDHYVEKIAETFLSCIDLPENYNDLISENLDGFQFCLKCKSRLEELSYVRSQIEKLLLRSKQLTMGIVADALLTVQQSSVPLENSSARWIRRLIRKKFLPRVFLKKCDSEKQTRKRGRPRKSCSVARKKPMAHSLRVSAEPKKIRQPENTELHASLLLPIKLEQFDSEDMEDFEMRDPLELDAIEFAQDNNTLMVKSEDGDTEVVGTPGSTLREPTLSDAEPSSVGSLRAEPLQLVRIEGNSYRFGEFPVERVGNSYKCLTCNKMLYGKKSSYTVKRHIRKIHLAEYRNGRQDDLVSTTFDPTLVREISSQDYLYRDSIPFTFNENERSFICGHCGVRFVSRTRTSGKKRIIKHLKSVHTLGKHDSIEEEAARERSVNSYEFRGVWVSMLEDKHICGACSKLFQGKHVREDVMMHIRQCHLKPPQFIWKSVTEFKPGEYLYQNKLHFAYVDGILQCGLCPRIFPAEKRPGVADISVVLHLKQDHSDMFNVSVLAAGGGEKPTEGMSSPVGSSEIIDVQCPTSLEIEQALLKLESAMRVKSGGNSSNFPFKYKDGVFQCGLCPWTFQTDNKRNVEKFVFWHFKGHYLGKPTKPVDQTQKPVERGRIVQKVSPATNSVAPKLNTHTRLDYIRKKAAEEGRRTSYECEGVRVTVINGKYICEAKGCSKFFVGKQASSTVLNHIRARHRNQPTCRLKAVAEVKPGESVKKLPSTCKEGIIQCGLCSRFFVTDKNPATAEEELMSHFKAEHSVNVRERKKPPERMKTPVEPTRSIQNLPTVNTVESQPVALLGQGSPPKLQSQPSPVLRNGQAVFAAVPASNQIPQVCLAQPAGSMPSDPVGQFSSVSPLHSATSNQPVPRSY